MVGRPLELGFDDLSQIAAEFQVDDVSRHVPGRAGAGVRLAAVLDIAQVRPEANYLTLHADRDDFHVSIPLAPVLNEAILVYRMGAEELSAKAGGPVRLLIPAATLCKTSELDECANVKYLSRLELTARKGMDTRPQNEAEHEELHARRQEQGDD
jgi:DMSO/TMAO reductase YedYZ molybdopterin-dependent catalytic subunit